MIRVNGSSTTVLQWAALHMCKAVDNCGHAHARVVHFSTARKVESFISLSLLCSLFLALLKTRKLPYSVPSS